MTKPTSMEQANAELSSGSHCAVPGDPPIDSKLPKAVQISLGYNALRYFSDVSSKPTKWPTLARSPYVSIVRRGEFGFTPLVRLVSNDSALFFNIWNERDSRDFPENWTFSFYNLTTANLLQMDTVASFGPSERMNKERLKVLARPMMSVLIEASRTGALNIIIYRASEPQLLKLPFTAEKKFELFTALAKARSYIPHEHHLTEELDALFLKRPYPRLSADDETMNVYHLAGDEVVSDTGVRFEDMDCCC